MTLGEKVEQLANLKNQAEQIKNQLTDINKQIDSMEFEIIESMDNAGLENVRTSFGTAIKKVELYPQVKDKDALVKWAYENGKPEILQSRVSKAVFDEFFEQSGAYPDGIDTYNKTTLLFRRAR